MSAFTILIVDDNHNNLFSLRTLIEENLSSKVVEANSGARCLDILLTEIVDLIILDVQMPEMDGFETARLIRSLKKTQHIPIVFLTAAYKSEEFQHKGFAVGGADYLTKPIDPAHLLAKLGLYLRFIAQERRYYEELRQTNAKLQEEIKIRQQTEAELLLAKEKAEEANLAKSRFMANMSHELRTPLNVIIGYTELLCEETEQYSPEHKDLSHILHSAQHLLELINDVLDISKIESGKMGVYYEVFNVRQLADDICVNIQPLVQKNGNTLELVGGLADEACAMSGDAAKIRQILFNLISNACKFTKQGDVRLILRTDEAEWVSFDVTDNGIGIAPEDQRKLFHAFAQVDTSTTRQYGGSGLGLIISRRLAQLLGGDITMVSTPGKGSTFTLRLPRTVPIQAEESRH